MGNARHPGRLALNIGLNKFEEELRFHSCIRWVMPAVMNFAGVCLQVKEFAIGGIAVDGEFITLIDQRA